MTHAALPTSAPPLSPHDLGAILAAWQDATSRLEQTHAALRAEVARLTDELHEKNRELARQSRLADLGRIAAHVAHEVRNNLVPVSLYLSLLRRRLGTTDAEALSVVDKIEAGFTSLDAMVGDLLNFTTDRDPRTARFALRDLIADVLDSLAPQFAAQGIDLRVDVASTLTIEADRGMLRRALLNLVLNALDAMPEGGELNVSALATPRGVELEVADSGPGLNEEALHRACEPFFSTKSTGVGLGLAVVARILEAHGGRVEAANCPEGGAAFTLVMPSRRALEAAA